MTTLYDCTAKVKPARRFGVGVLPYVAQHTFEPYTVSDAEWLLADEIRREEAARAEQRKIRLQSGIAEFMSFYESGLAAF